MTLTHPVHEFRYRNGELYCEDVAVARIAARTGTPVYIYSHQTIVDHYRKIRDAFRKVDPLVCFAMKTNSNLAVLAALAREGAGFDIVSGGELQKALRIGADPKKIVFASVGKTDEEIRAAVRAGILLFNVESRPELSAINRIARLEKRKVSAALRVNPDINAPTHEKINTGSLKKKFGIDLSTARHIFLHKKSWEHVDLCGVHIHIGSQITESAPFLAAIRRAVAFIDALTREGVAIDHLDIGGGLGIVYKDETPQTAAAFAARVLPLLEGKRFRLIMEPGRFIVGQAGILVTRKLYLKDNGVKKFMIVDAGMNDLVRPAMYGAYHEIIPVRRKASRRIICDVVGPICESGDVFAHGRPMTPVPDGECLAILSAGAYCYSMASNYNARPRPPEVMVHGNRWDIVQKRETFEDLVRGAVVPPFLRKPLVRNLRFPRTNNG